MPHQPIRLVAFLVVAVVAAACVRNPSPAAPATSVPATPPEGVAPDGPRPAAVPRTTRLTPHSYPFGPPGRFVRGSTDGLGPFPRTWSGLRLESRVRCPGYDPAFYSLDELRPRLPDAAGWRDALGCTLFPSAASTVVDPARLVSAAVAHDAGLCRADPVQRRAFAVDPDNLLYLPRSVAALRRYLADVGGPAWAPAQNRCWYVQAQLRIRRRYDLSVSPEEAAAFDAVLAECAATRVPATCGPHGAF